jgi:hypothetical protein
MIVLFALIGCIVANDCNIFLSDSSSGATSRSSNEIENADLDELVFLTELSRFMNERAPRLLQVRIHKIRSSN